MISINDRRMLYSGNGIATTFTAPRVVSASHLQVYSVSSLGVQTLISPAAYTVLGVGADVTRVRMNVAPASGTKLLLLRTVPYLQQIQFANQGAFYPELHEQAFDLAAMRDQQLDDRLAVVETASTAGDLTLRGDLASTASGAALVAFAQPFTGARSRSVRSKASEVLSVLDFIPEAEHAAIRNYTSVYDATADVQAAINAATSGLYIPSGLYLYAGNLSALFRTRSLTIYGDGPGLSILRQTTSGGIVFSAAATYNYTMPVLNLADLKLEAGAANCGAAVTMTYTGGSGYAGAGPEFRNVEIAPRQAGHYWTKGVRGTNVRNARFSRVVIGSNAITGQTTHGFHFDGADDPVELWFDDFCYLYVLTTGILVEGTYEGIYLHGINMTSVQDGLVWNGTGAQPVLHVLDSYINCQRVAVSADMISYFKIANNSFSSSGLGTGDFWAVKINRSTGNQTNAGDVYDNIVIGGNGYGGFGATENGFQLTSGNCVTLHGNTLYTLTKGIEALAGLSIRQYDNTFIAVATPVTIPAAMGTMAQSPECLLMVHGNASAQSVPVVTETKLTHAGVVSDFHNYYNSALSRWTPPAGWYRVSAACYFTTNVAVGDDVAVIFKKNGASVAQCSRQCSKAGQIGSDAHALIYLNGTDYLEVFVYIDGAGGNRVRAVATSLNYWHANRA